VTDDGALEFSTEDGARSAKHDAMRVRWLWIAGKWEDVRPGAEGGYIGTFPSRALMPIGKKRRLPAGRFQLTPGCAANRSGS
jgi:hypothetical protein